MSIWSSVAIHGGLQDNAWGSDYQPEGEPNHLVDVATATNWNDCIRVAIFGERENASVMVTTDTARDLAAFLHVAIDKIEQP